MIFEDAEERARQYPLTFDLCAERRALRPGDHAKVCTNAERSWVRVLEVERVGGKVVAYECAVDAGDWLQPMPETIRIEPRHVFAIILDVTTP